MRNKSIVSALLGNRYNTNNLPWAFLHTDHRKCQLTNGERRFPLPAVWSGHVQGICEPSSNLKMIRFYGNLYSGCCSAYPEVYNSQDYQSQHPPETRLLQGLEALGGEDNLRFWYTQHTLDYTELFSRTKGSTSKLFHT